MIGSFAGWLWGIPIQLILAGGEGSTFAAGAFSSTLGAAGQWVCIICLFLFGLSSMICIVQSVKIQAVSTFNSLLLGRIFQAVVLALIVGGCLGSLESIFVFCDLAGGIILLLNIPALILLWKPLCTATQEWFGNNGDLEAITRQRQKSVK